MYKFSIFYALTLAILSSQAIIAPASQTAITTPPLLRAATAQAQVQACRPYLAIFARGSGQSYGADEFAALTTTLQNTNIAIEELNYPAITIAPQDLFGGGLGNLLGAWVSAGLANDYGRSVSTGKQNLAAKIAETAKTCPNTRFVLAGYSQGAQVIADALPNIPSDQILAVGLFGEPKLYLPEGKGLIPPACQNHSFSSYRAIVPECRTAAGALKARISYHPKAYENKVYLYCNSADFVCGSTKNPLSWRGHGEYKEAPMQDFARRVNAKIAQTTTHGGGTPNLPHQDSDQDGNQDKNQAQNQDEDPIISKPLPREILLIHETGATHRQAFLSELTRGAILNNHTVHYASYLNFCYTKEGYGRYEYSGDFCNFYNFQPYTKLPPPEGNFLGDYHYNTFLPKPGVPLVQHQGLIDMLNYAMTNWQADKTKPKQIIFLVEGDINATAETEYLKNTLEKLKTIPNLKMAFISPFPIYNSRYEAIFTHFPYESHIAATPEDFSLIAKSIFSD